VENDNGQLDLQIDYEAIAGITDEKLYKEVTEALSKEEEYLEDIYDATERIEEIEDEAYEIS